MAGVWMTVTRNQTIRFRRTIPQKYLAFRVTVARGLLFFWLMLLFGTFFWVVSTFI